MKSTYNAHSQYSDPGKFAAILNDWPSEPMTLAKTISRYIFHIGSPECKRVYSSELHLKDLHARSVPELLERNHRPGETKPFRKIAGVCRDFALLAVAAFRSNAVPARLRVGFATYLVESFFEDHWLCEYHDGRSWRLFDAEVAACPSIADSSFDACDVPQHKFLSALNAWNLIQSGTASPANFGVSRLNIGGEWFAAASGFRDAAALCGLELKPWDYWGINSQIDLANSNATAQCRVATVRLSDAILQSNTNNSLQMPTGLDEWLPIDHVISYATGEPEIVPIRQT